MAEEVKSVANDVKTTENVVETPKVVSVDEYNALKTKLESLESTFKEKVNQASKAEREKFEKQLAKATLTEAEKLKLEQEEKFNALNSELTTLKTEKKQFTIKQHLQENQLPNLFVNDIRLVNAEIDDIPKVVKELKKEYSELIKEVGKPAVVGTAPQKTPTQTTNAEYADLVKKYPFLKDVYKG
jgi:DNA repair exonuclease SbcCD ATPase subunit